MFALASPAAARDYGHPHSQSGANPVPAVGATVSVSPASLAFPTQRAGTFSGVAKTVTVTNTGLVAVTISRIFTTTSDYFGFTSCFDHTTLASGASCTITTYFLPNASGTRNATLEIVDDAAGSPHKVTLTGQGVEGYYIASAKGGVAPFGDAVNHGNALAIGLTAPIISIKTTSNGTGYWLLASDGGIFSYGNAAFYGSTGAIHLNQPVVGMERTVTGKGYWLVARDGGIFSFGDAKFYGSTGAIHLNQPVVGMARTPTGNGYWLVARDGGIFSFGDAKFFGSTGAIHLNSPIVGMAPRPNGKGYWMTAGDGGIFAFGDAKFYGSAAGIANGKVVDMAATPDGGGYWLVSNIGSVFRYGNAAGLGDLVTAGVTATDVVGLAPTSPPVPVDFF
ncbi:MAG TPA: choice-of-anchor D domain-containing protein [Acidimicrobiia bacterium]